MKNIYLLLIVIFLFIQCKNDPTTTTSTSENKSYSYSEDLKQIILNDFSRVPVKLSCIPFNPIDQNAQYDTILPSTKHIPARKFPHEAINVPVSYFDDLVKNNFITEEEKQLFIETMNKVQCEMLDQAGLDIYTENSDNHNIDKLDITGNANSQEFNQFSPLIRVGDKAFFYKLYFSQFKTLPAVTDGTFYFYVRENNFWRYVSKYVAWIS